MTDLFRDVSVDEITPGLFVGNMACVESERTLRQLKITTVVSVVSKYRNPFPQPSTQYGTTRCRRHPLEKLYNLEDRIVIFVDDTRSDNIFRHFEGACEFISHQLHKAGGRNQAGSDTNTYGKQRGGGSVLRDHTVKKSGRVLVHCTLGISRSITIIAAYIMWRWGFGAARALQFIKEKRNTASPNEGFIDQLLVWEELRCNPWLSRRFHIRPQAYYNMVGRLENYKRIREAKRAMEGAPKKKAARSSHRTRDSTNMRSVDADTVRYSTRAKH